MQGRGWWFGDQPVEPDRERPGMMCGDLFFEGEDGMLDLIAFAVPLEECEQRDEADPDVPLGWDDEEDAD